MEEIFASLNSNSLSLSNLKGRIGIIGLFGMGIDLAIFFLLRSLSFPLASAHILSFALCGVFNYLLNVWVAKKSAESPKQKLGQFGRFAVIALMALFLRGGVLATMMDSFGWQPQYAIFPAVIAAALIFLPGMILWVFPPVGLVRDRTLGTPIAAMAIIAYMVLLRLFYLDGPELLPQEAYYWIYAQHLDIGYLDHPPMVAWIIWLFNGIFGVTELGVRFGAFLSWFIASYFTFKLTRNLFSRSTALRVLLLLATMPFFIGSGFLMTPDAPLVACWAATLFYLERCLIGGKRWAWYGVGLWMGLGLLSKYTIALLAPGMLLFLLLDRDRSNLKRPEPYLAAALSFLLFLPVILWNVQNSCASFMFQGPRRFGGSFDFTLPALMGSVLLLLTPTGVMASLAFFAGGRGEYRWEWLQGKVTTRRRLFGFVFTLFPLLVFLAFSLVREAKLNWTGPVWLAILPFIAQQIALETHETPTRLVRFLHRAWPPTIVVTVLVSGGLLHFLTLGIPGFPYPQDGNLSSMAGWKDLATQMEAIENSVEEEAGAEPFIVGMDKNKIASELTFYRYKQSRTGKGSYDDEGLLATTGRHLFGMESLMYKYWLREAEIRDLAKKGIPLILVSREPREFSKDRIKASGWEMGAIKELIVRKNGAPAGQYYYAIATSKPSSTEAH